MLRVNWVPFEPQSGGDLQWEVELALAAGYQPGMTKHDATPDKAHRFSSKVAAQAHVNRLCADNPETEGVITVRLIRS